MSDPQKALKNLKPTREFFIGVDSDGCAFDTMEIKQKECFCPAFIRTFGLQAVSKYARETWEFVNLYSRERGKNRFPALVSALDLLRGRDEVKQRKVKVPRLKRLRQWIKEETRLGNPVLKKLVKETGDTELKQVLGWSEEVNQRVQDMVRAVPPFPLVRDSLKKAQAKADLMVVSQTPLEALSREWRENGIDKLVRIIAGQEYGTKSEHIALGAREKYPSDKILMVGDAPGDLKAALDNEALFYPVLPGREEESWHRFYEEALDRFFKGTFKGGYMDGLRKEFEKALPEKPPW
jgi:phosphoglycolate phosphatase-like HAD superfamily hydrolase